MDFKKPNIWTKRTSGCLRAKRRHTDLTRTKNTRRSVARECSSSRRVKLANSRRCVIRRRRLLSVDVLSAGHPAAKRHITWLRGQSATARLNSLGSRERRRTSACARSLLLLLPVSFRCFPLVNSVFVGCVCQRRVYSPLSNISSLSSAFEQNSFNLLALKRAASC